MSSIVPQRGDVPKHTRDALPRSAASTLAAIAAVYATSLLRRREPITRSMIERITPLLEGHPKTLFKDGAHRH
ncbi:MAG: hypothetical protein AAFX10_10765 [Pseudomonadota bacterium]